MLLLYLPDLLPCQRKYWYWFDRTCSQKSIYITIHHFDSIYKLVIIYSFRCSSIFLKMKWSRYVDMSVVPCAFFFFFFLESKCHICRLQTFHLFPYLLKYNCQWLGDSTKVLFKIIYDDSVSRLVNLKKIFLILDMTFTLSLSNIAILFISVVSWINFFILSFL